MSVAAAGCGDDGGGGDIDAAIADGPVGQPDAPVDQPDAPVDQPDAGVPADGVDILFVVDNSGSMQEEQALLTAAFQGFMQELEAAAGGRPDIHIGVVSTDLGSGPFAIAGCGGAGGDNGILQNTPRGACTPPTDRFIRDVDDGAGGRDTNFVGNIEETFACIAELGIDGCGFEQPLESMRRALDGSNALNNGFLRADASLAVIFVSDEDDCSVFDTSMFDTSQNDIDSPLGPLSSFRCFEFGVQCDPDTPRTAGARSNCVPRAGSAFMSDSQVYIDFLRGLKPPGRVVVGTIQGDPTPVAVQIDPNTGNPALAPSCITPDTSAAPGVRLQAVTDGFPGRAVTGSICSDFSTTLQTMAQLIAATL